MTFLLLLGPSIWGELQKRLEWQPASLPWNIQKVYSRNKLLWQDSEVVTSSRPFHFSRCIIFGYSRISSIKLCSEGDSLLQVLSLLGGVVGFDDQSGEKRPRWILWSKTVKGKNSLLGLFQLPVVRTSVGALVRWWGKRQLSGSLGVRGVEVALRRQKVLYCVTIYKFDRFEILKQKCYFINRLH